MNWRKALANIEMDEWECDGCGFVCDHDADICEGKGCEVHDSYGFHKDCKGDFWGWMKVGGKAWQAFHEKNIHPMTPITNDIMNLVHNPEERKN